MKQNDVSESQRYDRFTLTLPNQGKTQVESDGEGDESEEEKEEQPVTKKPDAATMNAAASSLGLGLGGVSDLMKSVTAGVKNQVKLLQGRRGSTEFSGLDEKLYTEKSLFREVDQLLGI